MLPDRTPITIAPAFISRTSGPGEAKIDAAIEGFDSLVQKAQNGDRGAMDQVLEILRPHLEPIARPFADPARPVESTSDLLQEVCLRTWNKIRKFEGGQNDAETFKMFRGWVGQIVRRLGLNAQRDRQRLKRKPPQKVLRLAPWPVKESSDTSAGFDPPSPDPTPSAHARTDEAEQRVRAALEKITDEPEATILRLRFFEGLTLLQIAERLELGEKKVRLRYEKAIARLQRDTRGLE